jgi:hypothetical protein
MYVYVLVYEIGDLACYVRMGKIAVMKRTYENGL